MSIVVKLKGNHDFEHMKNKHVIECFKCSFSCSFSILDSLLQKGFILTDKFGNEYKFESDTSTPHIASRGGSNPTTKKKRKNNSDDSQISMGV